MMIPHSWSSFSCPRSTENEDYPLRGPGWVKRARFCVQAGSTVEKDLPDDQRKGLDSPKEQLLSPPTRTGPVTVSRSGVATTFWRKRVQMHSTTSHSSSSTSHPILNFAFLSLFRADFFFACNFRSKIGLAVTQKSFQELFDDWPALRLIVHIVTMKINQPPNML